MEIKRAQAGDVKQKFNLIKNEEVLADAQKEEREFLSLVLTNRDLLEDVISHTNITHDFFFYLENARIFAIASYYHIEHNQSLTESAIEQITKGHKNPEAERAAIKRVMKTDICEKGDFDRLKNNMIDRYNQQCFYELVFETQGGDAGLAHKILNATRDQTNLISEFQDKMLSFEKKIKDADQFTKISSFMESLGRVVEDIGDRRTNPEKHYGWMTGYKSIDSVIYGMRPGKYGLVIGYPGGGKTTFMINLALGFAKSGAKVCYVTVESDDDEVSERMLCNIADVSSKMLKEGGSRIDDDMYRKILKARDHIKSNFGENLTFITVPQGTEVKTVLSLVERKRRTSGLDILIVDYLDVLAPNIPVPNHRDQEIGQMSVCLQSYGKKQGLGVISAQSFNNETIKMIRKQLMKEKDQEDGDVSTILGPDSVGGSQKLSRDCDYMWGLIMSRDQLFVYWMKSRSSEKAEMFKLRAMLDYCKLIEEEKYFDLSKPGVSSDLIDAFNQRQEMKKEKEREECERSLKEGERLLKMGEELDKAGSLSQPFNSFDPSKEATGDAELPTQIAEETPNPPSGFSGDE
jgi:replicative DNA helicase